MFAIDDTIAAVATPPGRGGIGVVRLSGPDAGRIAQALIGRVTPLEPRHATFARLVEPAGDGAPRVVDQVVATAFPGPASYTGDDVVEISAHGSPLLLERIVVLAMQAGARLAEPGEFTFRAYVNGRLDLVQAEAVADLIEAVTPLQARAAMDQLEGTLTGTISRIDAALFDLVARLEASLDFPDEGFHFVTPDEVEAGLARVNEALEDLVRDGRRGRVVREGAVVVIVGPPNAGKSSLFNALVGSARAIVTDVPGTTRDMVTERVDVGGLAVTLVDTAGLRETVADAVEAEGVARARQAQEIARLRLVVVDGSLPFRPSDQALMAPGRVPSIVVVNKSDLQQRWEPPDAWPDDARLTPVSATTGDGVDSLRQTMLEVLGGTDDYRDVPAITNLRHLALVDDARGALAHARTRLAEGATEEIVLTELAAARAALEAVTGRRDGEDVLRHIFARFCIGK